ncbi:hypothetical protein DPMN_054538 [Dreissena polymorpha]|uniref:Uncharacterized protein n=1 Tax=Dreissena polymorpha TaxID=45954 RepID=A0A9D4CNB2_DREPO|nr:hypothetical protein DPMN_054538 [Dreissena polymorpha]
MFFDGDSAADKVLGKLCNTCDNYFTVQSTKNTMSILLRTGRDIASNSNFRIKYQQGRNPCLYE